MCELTLLILKVTKSVGSVSWKEMKQTREEELRKEIKKRKKKKNGFLKEEDGSAAVPQGHNYVQKANHWT